MAKKPRTAPKQEAAIDLAKLGEIVHATVAGGFLYANADEIAPLVAAEFVETNHAMIDESGNVAARATPKGIEAVNPTATNTADTAAVSAAATEAPARASAFEIDDYVPNLTIKRGGRGGEIYPFDSLEVNKSFHVPATPDKPDPAKSLASTVSSATARYAVGTGTFEDVTVTDYQLDGEGKRVKGADGKFIKTGEHVENREVMKKTREFIVRSVGAEDPRGPGARVIRIA